MSEQAFLDTPFDIKEPRQAAALRLVGARVALDADTAVQADLEISNGRITAIKTNRVGAASGFTARSPQASHTVDLAGYLLLPGLINAHDHLEFNLFPRLGQGPYVNFEDWAKDVYHPLQSPVREHLLVPKPFRQWWGALKNLLSGVTTVCHHNSAIPRLLARSFPIRVVDRYGWAHSLAFGGNVREAFESTPADNPFIVHLAEGTDQRSKEEIYRLDHMQALGPNTVIVHGVGLDDAGHALLEQRGAGLVWCPTSNMFTLGKTLGARELEQHKSVALGSDSALTGEGDLLDEIHAVGHYASLSPKKIYSMVTDSAARVLRLRNGKGAIRVGGPADFLVVSDSGDRPCTRLTQMTTRDLEAVIVGSRPKLFSAAAAGRWPRTVLNTFEVIRIGNVERLVQAPIRKLLEGTREILGMDIFLAGKRVTG